MVVIRRIDVEAQAGWRDLKAVGSMYIYFTAELYYAICNNIMC